MTSDKATATDDYLLSAVGGPAGGVNRGILHPATFSGQIVGQTMTLTVTLTDNGQVVGPVTLIYRKEPKMGPCPICRVPPKAPISPES